jgi:prolipoprotein diacylglyceryltransferase
LEVQWYGILIALGMALGMILEVKRAGREGISYSVLKCESRTKVLLKSIDLLIAIS